MDCWGATPLAGLGCPRRVCCPGQWRHCSHDSQSDAWQVRCTQLGSRLLVQDCFDGQEDAALARSVLPPSRLLGPRSGWPDSCHSQRFRGCGAPRGSAGVFAQLADVLTQAHSRAQAAARPRSLSYAHVAESCGLTIFTCCNRSRARRRSCGMWPRPSWSATPMR